MQLALFPPHILRTSYWPLVRWADRHRVAIVPAIFSLYDDFDPDEVATRPGQ